MSVNRSQSTKVAWIFSSRAAKFLIVVAVLEAVVIVLQATGGSTAITGRLTPHSGPAASAPAQAAAGWYGAIPQNSPLFNPDLAAQQRETVVTHSEALQGDLSYAGGYYGALPQTSPEFNWAVAEQQREIVVNHGEALQGNLSYGGGYYGAIAQTSPDFNWAVAEEQREMIVRHGDALQEVP